MGKVSEKIFVALDTPSLDVVRRLTKELEGVINRYKIGKELFTAHGWEAVEVVRKTGARVFLDLKFHDIPNTVSKTAAVISEHDVFMFNVHALGGYDMMKKARQVLDERAESGKRKPILLGVTILTSHTEENIRKELGINLSVEEAVIHLAKMARNAGLDGVVSSPQEIEMLRKEFGPDFVIVTPGIRPVGSPTGDQKRIFTPKQAIDAGASYLVIGRPITAAKDPRKAAEEILASL